MSVIKSKRKRGRSFKVGDITINEEIFFDVGDVVKFKLSHWSGQDQENFFIIRRIETIISGVVDLECLQTGESTVWVHVQALTKVELSKFEKTLLGIAV